MRSFFAITVALLVAFFFLSLCCVAIYFELYGPHKNTVFFNKQEDQLFRFSSGSIRINIQGDDKNNTVVLLHGFNSSLERWNKVVPLLVGCGKIIRLDIPGYGFSQWGSDDFSLQAQSARVVKLLERLDVENVSLVGTSMGASIAATLAASFPDKVASLVLIAPSAYPGSLKSSMGLELFYRPGMANKLATYLVGTTVFKKLFPESVMLQALSVTASYGQPWADSLSKIKQPTTLIWSEADKTASFQYADKILASLANARLVMAEADSGHHVVIKEPGLIARQLCQ